MNVQKISEKEIVIALLDAGMDTEKINEFIESINSEYFQKSKTIFYKGIMPSETGFRFSSGL